MSKIKVTIYERETACEGYRYVAHTDSFCGVGHSDAEAIGDLLIQINTHVPEDLYIGHPDLEVQQPGHLAKWFLRGLM